MKEKFLMFSDGHRLRIIKEGPYIKEDPKHRYCDTCEYVTSGGDIYKVVKPGVKQVSNETWFVRCVTRNGEEYWAGCGVREVVEEEHPNLFTDFTLPEYCVLHGKKCDHCSCEVSGYCQARTADPVDVFKSMQKRIDNLIDRANDQDKEIIELISKNTSLDKRNTNLNVEVLEKQEQIRKLEKDNYIANDNLTAIAAENMQLRDENTKLKEKVDVYNKEVKQWLNGFYGQPLQPLYCCAGARSGGKTLFTENEKLKAKNKKLEEVVAEKNRKIAELEKANKSLYVSYYKRGDEMYNYKKALALIDRDSVKHSGRGPSIVEAYGVYKIYGFDFCTTDKNDYTFVVNMLRKARM